MRDRRHLALALAFVVAAVGIGLLARPGAPALPPALVVEPAAADAVPVMSAVAAGTEALERVEAPRPARAPLEQLAAAPALPVTALGDLVWHVGRMPGAPSLAQLVPSGDLRRGTASTGPDGVVHAQFTLSRSPVSESR